MKWITGFWLVMNLVTYVSYGLDKQRARRGKWRISERTLLWLSASGGAVGGWRGMKDFRHKTYKRNFQILIPLFAVIQVVLLYLIFFQWVEPTWESMLLFVGATFLQAVLFWLLKTK